MKKLNAILETNNNNDIILLQNLTHQRVINFELTNRVSNTPVAFFRYNRGDTFAHYTIDDEYNTIILNTYNSTLGVEINKDEIQKIDLKGNKLIITTKLLIYTFRIL